MRELIVEATEEEYEDILKECGEDAPQELIRCKDCKYYEPDLYANPWGTCCHREWVVEDTGHAVDNDGHCYRAERKEE